MPAKTNGAAFEGSVQRDDEGVGSSSPRARLDRYGLRSPNRGAAVIKRPCNGWTFWTYQRAPGDWVRLDTLRH